jgi:drug/metabolite transporter (DMT)-like permease
MTRPKGFTLLMLLFPLLWAGSFVAGKWAIRDFSPEITSLLRFLLASVVLLPFAFKRPPAKGAWKPRNLGVVFLLGLTGMFGYHVFFYYSLKYTSAGNSSLIISTDSLLTVLLAVLFLKERLSPRKALGIAIGFAGVIWVISDGALAYLLVHGPNRGDLLALAAALAWAVYSVLSKPIAHLFPSFDLSWMTYVVGSVLLSPWLLAQDARHSLATATLVGWASVAYMALFATGIGYFLYLKGIHEIGAVATSKYIFLVPVYVLALAWVFLGEPVPLHKVAAAGVIILGLWIAEEPDAEDAMPASTPPASDVVRG